MADFTIDVPIGGNLGGGSAGGGSSEVVDTNKKIIGSITKLRRTIVESLGITKVLSDIVADLFNLIRPLIKLLSALLIVIFLPLMPLLSKLSTTLAGFVAKVAAAGGGLSGIQAGATSVAEDIIQKEGKTIAGIIAAVLIALGALLLIAFGGWIPGLLLILASIIIAFWDDIVLALKDAWAGFLESWEALKGFVLSIWTDIIKPAWDFMIGIGEKIWTEILKPAWEWFTDIGQKIWDILKVGFDFVVTGLKNVVNGIIDLLNKVPGVNIPRLAEGGIVTRPTLALIGESGPEAVVPLNKGGFGGMTIQINNPTFRDESDMRRLTDLISQRLQSRLKGRIS